MTEAELRELLRHEVGAALRGGRPMSIPSSGGGGSLAAQIVASDAFKRFVEQRARTSDDITLRSSLTPGPGETIPALKFLATSQLGRATQASPRLEFAMRSIRIRDLVAVVGLQAPSLSYTRITGFSNNAATVAEGGTKPTSTIVSEPVRADAKVVATFIPTSRQSLQDAAGLRVFLESVLESAVLDEEDDQVLNGDGTGENLLGLLNTAGVQTQAVGAEASPATPKLIAIRKAITKVQTAFTSSGFNPDALVLHPSDAEDLDLLTDTTGRYLLLPDGSPANAEGARNVWALRVVVTPAIAAGTGLVGDFGQAMIGSWSPLTVRLSDSHGTFFVENKVAVLAEERLLLATFSPAAFCKVTGL